MCNHIIYLYDTTTPVVLIVLQVFIGNSAKYSDIGHPFGYMKASTNLQAVNLFVMPYNYPALIPLLGELPWGLILLHLY